MTRRKKSALVQITAPDPIAIMKAGAVAVPFMFFGLAWKIVTLC